MAVGAAAVHPTSAKADPRSPTGCSSPVAAAVPEPVLTAGPVVPVPELLAGAATVAVVKQGPSLRVAVQARVLPARLTTESRE